MAHSLPDYDWDKRRFYLNEWSVIKSSLPFYGLPIYSSDVQIIAGSVSLETYTCYHELGSDDILEADWNGNISW